MPKRANGEGSSIQFDEERNSYWTQLSLGFVNGKRQRKTLRAATQGELLDLMDQEKATYKRGVKLGLVRDVAKQTVGEYLTFWLEKIVSVECSPKTHMSYSQIARLHLVPALGDIKLSALRPQHVRTLLAEKAKSALSPRSVAYIRAVLRSAISSAVADDLIVDNVVTRTKPPRGEAATEISPLTPDQCRTLLDAVRGDRWEALFTVGLACGLRQSEALGLSWDFIDFSSGEMRIEWALQRITVKLPDGTQRRELHLLPPKRHSRRTITLPTVVLDALRTHRDLQRQERELSASKWRDSVVRCEGVVVTPNFVFRMPSGTAVEGCFVNKLFNRILKNCGVPPHRHHDLRHTAATLLLLMGVPHRVIMQILGWSQISMLQRYTHVLREMQQSAALKMDEVLAPRPARPEEPELLASKLASSGRLHRVK